MSTGLASMESWRKPFSHVAEFRVHRMGQGVDDGRLEFARDHEAGALVVHQILDQAAHPLIDVAVVALLRALGNAQTGGSSHANSSTSPARSGSR